jgi:hypothetical protein
MLIEMVYKITMKCRFKTESKALSNENNHFPSVKIWEKGGNPFIVSTSYISHAK